MNDTVQRKWLTYNKENKCLYCSYCLAFEFPNTCNASPFVLGFSDYRHISQSLDLHESTTTHIRNAQKYISVVKGGTLDDFLATSLNKKKKEVRKQRNIVMRIIDIIKMLSKQALPFRGHRNESAYTLDNDILNHGNFLATVQLMAKYDPIMAVHVSSVQYKSEQRLKRLEQQGKTESKGRGGLVTYLSIICERLLSVVPSNDGTGQGLFNLLSQTLEHHKIDPRKCLSDSTDGAASYHGQYKGLQSKLVDVANHHVHIWCYAHVLNLDLTDTTKFCVAAVSFFSLLQNLATFLRTSYKRMAVWIEVVGKEMGQEKMKRLKLIGETRSSGKSNAASVMFGRFEKPSVSTFVNLLTCLSIIQNLEKFDAKTKHEANALVHNLLKFETILTAFSYLYIFETTAPMSSYLQTSCLDMFTSWNLVDSATTKLKERARTFHNVHSKALEFLTKCNEQISQMNMVENETLEIDIIETALPVKRQRKKKKMADELANDEGNSSDPVIGFRVNVFILIMDRIVQSLEDRFVQHKQLYKDLSCLDPVNFKTIVEKGLEDEALEGIMKLFPQSSKYQIKLELFSFASNFDVLKLLLNNGENLMASSCNNCKTCSTCPSCVLNF
ncbi:hypothetical protein AVEN_227428-1 [Araneus ventricosus]|uniref:Uncharacterized protein n=1 Tax=Araneus ventricosus TaxID=182803 RepID=A0A4Y2R6K3_ARAVE|nr:hypothetical protein AVEN_227428-1 [Araneus ventricosus]